MQRREPAEQLVEVIRIAASAGTLRKRSAMIPGRSTGRLETSSAAHHGACRVPRAEASILVGSPVSAAQGDPEPLTTFMVAVIKWSDGTPALMEH
jgi:hypothetical protein